LLNSPRSDPKYLNPPTDNGLHAIEPSLKRIAPQGHGVFASAECFLRPLPCQFRRRGRQWRPRVAI